MTWYVVPGRPLEDIYDYEDDPVTEWRNRQIWTVSESPDQEGWNTDMGFDGYGLTYAQAKFLADAANEKLEREQSAS